VQKFSQTKRDCAWTLKKIVGFLGMGLSAGMPTVSCDDSGWGFELFSHLEHNEEVDLVRFDLNVHYDFCAGAAKRFGMDISYDPDDVTLRFRRRSWSLN
jgi:hypothetical protein